MKSLAEFNNQKLAETINPLKEAWYFETILDKAMLITAVVLAVWKIIEIIGGFF